LNPVTDFKLKQYRQRTSVVDGFGTLTTPFGTFEVLRIKSVINELDSVYQTFFGGGTWNVLPQTVITEYEWWAQGKEDAMLKIVAVENNGNSQIRSIEYQDVYLGLDASIEEKELAVSISPNPANNTLTLSSDFPLEKVSISTLNGSKIFSQELNSTFSKSLDISALNSGIYFVKISSGKQVATKKLIKL
jgi:hypothetical protein